MVRAVSGNITFNRRPGGYQTAWIGGHFRVVLAEHKLRGILPAEQRMYAPSPTTLARTAAKFDTAENFDKTPLEVIELFGKLDFVTSFHLIPVGGITPLPDGCDIHWKDVRSIHRLGKESSWFTSGSLYHLLLGTARGMNNSQLNRLSKTQLGGAPTQRTIRNRRFWQGGHHGEEAYQT
jgi:hypothetical protein